MTTATSIVVRLANRLVNQSPFTQTSVVAGTKAMLEPSGEEGMVSTEASLAMNEDQLEK